MNNSQESKYMAIEFEVRGWGRLRFEEGWRTCDMEEGGLSIRRAGLPGAPLGILAGGCLDRNQTLKLRDFLTSILELWETSMKPDSSSG